MKATYHSGKPPAIKALWARIQVAIGAARYALKHAKNGASQPRGFKACLEPWCRLVRHDWFKNTEGWRRCRRCWFTEFTGHPKHHRVDKKILAEDFQFREGGYEMWDRDQPGPPKDPDAKVGFKAMMRARYEAMRQDRSGNAKACPDPLLHHVDCKDQEPKP